MGREVMPRSRSYAAGAYGFSWALGALAGMGIAKGSGNVGDDSFDLRNLQPMLCRLPQDFRQRLPFQMFHDHEMEVDVAVHVIDAHDVRMQEFA